ncbi:MAG: 2OG-Fe(II) oxygenase [Propylenella sp.]
MNSLTEEIKESLVESVRSADSFEAPYRHWHLRDVFPHAVYSDLKVMPFPVADLGGVSGTREAHNPDRVYLAGDNLRKFDSARATAEAFQDPETVDLLTTAFDARLDETFVRIEYAQDMDGFWLKPHTDIGVKMFTMLIYMSDDPRHADLGTDIYADENTRVGRSLFEPNSAMIFVPATNTWHGFERRPIHGVRRSIIVNYVTPEWRARDQLAFPQKPVSGTAA